MTFIYTDRNGVEWAVTSYGMTRLFRKRTPWIRFTQWVKRILAVVGLMLLLAGCVWAAGCK